MSKIVAKLQGSAATKYTYTPILGKFCWGWRGSTITGRQILVGSMTIADLNNGDAFKVKRVVLGREIGKRLADMGFVPGAAGKVVRSALLGDPLQVKICYYDISLRRKEASGVEIEPEGSQPSGMSKLGKRGGGG
ncbi:MAG: ferrous iron transport protein A [Candidatus Omnitrophica bacterium]|nr:ferrous iron transport protein A [Candidatus Omnitrophota bacterium]